MTLHLIHSYSNVLHCSDYINKLSMFHIIIGQRWSEYNTNVLEYEYDYFEHA